MRNIILRNEAKGKFRTPFAKLCIIIFIKYNNWKVDFIVAQPAEIRHFPQGVMEKKLSALLRVSEIIFVNCYSSLKFFYDLCANSS